MLYKAKYKSLILLLVFILISIVGVSYAWFLYSEKEKDVYSFTSGCLSVTIQNVTNAVNVGDATPISDVLGLRKKTYDFKITNNCQDKANYHINLETLNTTTLNANYIKVALASDTFNSIINKLSDIKEETKVIGNATKAYTLYEGELAGKASKSFSLRLWLDQGATSDAQDKLYKSKINVLTNPEYIIEKKAEVKVALDNGSIKGTVQNISNGVLKYCYTKDLKCTPNRQVNISNGGVTIPWEPKNYDQTICSQVDNGIVYCSEIYRDVNPPTAPSINYYSGELHFENATDNLGTVTYYYSLGCNNNYTVGTKVVPSAQTMDVCSYTKDDAGNQSAVTRRRLVVSDAHQYETPTRYLCTKDNQYYTTSDAAAAACNNDYIAKKVVYKCRDNSFKESANSCPYSYAGTVAYRCDDNTYRTTANSCSRQLTAEWQSCNTGYTGSGSTCTKTTTPTCPSGYTYNGSTCERYEGTSITPTTSYTRREDTIWYSCTDCSTSGEETCSGYSNCNGDTCYKCSYGVMTSAHQCIVCPSGYSYYSGGTCYRDWVDEDICRDNCPNQCTGSTCYVPYSSASNASTCTKKAGKETCYWEHHHTTTGSDAGNCSSNVGVGWSNDGSAVADPFEDREGKCSGYNSLTFRTKTYTQYCVGTTYCLTGSVVGNYCYSYKTRDVCSSGTYSNGSCVESYTRSRVCNGQVTTSTTCTQTYTGELKYSCQTGYQDTQTCSGYENGATWYQCDNGTRQDNSLCKVAASAQQTKYYCQHLNSYYDSYATAQSTCGTYCNQADGEQKANKCYKMQ